MDSQGFLIIRARVIIISGPSRAVMEVQKVIVRTFCYRSEAVNMVREHKRQVREYLPGTEYDYAWQVAPENANNWD